MTDDIVRTYASGPSDPVRFADEQRADKEDRMLHRRVSEHHANMRQAVDGIRQICESQGLSRHEDRVGDTVEQKLTGVGALPDCLRQV